MLSFQSPDRDNRSRDFTNTGRDYLRRRSVDYPDRVPTCTDRDYDFRLPGQTFPSLHTAVTHPFHASPTWSLHRSHFATRSNSETGSFSYPSMRTASIPVGFLALTGRCYLPFSFGPDRGCKHPYFHENHSKCNFKPATEAIRLQKKNLLCKSTMLFHLHLFWANSKASIRKSILQPNARKGNSYRGSALKKLKIPTNSLLSLEFLPTLHWLYRISLFVSGNNKILKNY